MSDSSREDRIDQVIAAYIAAVEEGGDPDPDPWLEQHPDIAGELARGLRDYLLSLNGASPSASAAPGRILDGCYVLRRLIGRGPMSRVYEAEDLQTGEPVAVKLVVATRLDPVHRARILRGIESIGELDHPNILPILAWGEDGEEIYLAMPLVEGPDLASRIRARRQDSERTPDREHDRVGSTEHQIDRWRSDARLIRQVAEALDHVHQRGILHRDVKPGNILIDPVGRPLLIDFDLAKGLAHPDLTRLESWVGTPRYMAPERFLGWCDARSEVYALGLILYELLTGRPAFEGGSEPELLGAVRRGRPRRPRRIFPEIPEAMERIALKAMDREPSRRYQTAGAMADDLGRFLDHRPVQARPPSPANQLVRWGREYPLSAALLVLLTLAMLLGAVSSTALWRRTERMRAEAVQTRIRAEQDRERARRSRAEAVAALEAEQEAVQLAHRRFQLAMDAVQTLHSDLAGDVRLQQPGFNLVRTRLLETTLEFYERLLRDERLETGAEPEDLLLTASALYQVGNLCNGLADLDRGIQAYEQCRTILQQLVDSGQAPEGTHLKLAEVLHVLAQHRHNQGKPDEAHDLWGQADALLDEVRAEPGGDREAVGLLAAMTNGRGVAAAKEGRPEEAEQLWCRCVELCRTLPMTDRMADGLGLPSSMALMNLAVLARSGRAPDRAEGLILQAIAELRPQVEARPDQASFRSTLCSFLIQLGQLRSGRAEWTGAIGPYREARRLGDGLVDELPNMVSYQKQALLAYSGLISCCLELLRLVEADRTLKAARTQCDRFVAMEPGAIGFRIRQVEFELTRGDLLALQGRFAEASARYARALDRLEVPPLVDSPGPAVRTLFGRALGKQALALVRAGRPDEALRIIEADSPEAEALDSSSRAVLQLARASAMADLGSFDEARQAFSRFDAHPNPSWFQYELAASRARLAAGSADPVDQQHAMAALRKARALNFFRGPAHTQRLRIDPFFDALRDRDDFRTMLLDLPFPADPFAVEPADLEGLARVPLPGASPGVDPGPIAESSGGSP